METLFKPTSADVLDNLCRGLLLKLLEDISDAGLTILDDEGRHFFGDAGAMLQAELEVLSPRFYRNVVLGGSIGAAESFVAGEWRSENLMTVIRIFARNRAAQEKLENQFGWLRFPLSKLRHWRQRNTRAGSRANIAAHYDLGNDLYQQILDPWMQYSSGVFHSVNDTLETAQENKLESICEALRLKPTDHVIEIGTGWGGLACFIAKHYGCRVTTTTLSKQQYEYAKTMIEHHGVSDRVELLLKDYRDLEGRYDKVVSVEMIEAVGYDFLPIYFAKLESLLKPGGRLFIQAITITDRYFESYRNDVDFIQRYIFPGGCLPSLSEMSRQLSENTSMHLDSIKDYGIDYAQTLEIWAQRFRNAGIKLQTLGYDDDFQRLWDFYFAYCEAGFREHCTQLVHFTADKPALATCPGSGSN